MEILNEWMRLLYGLNIMTYIVFYQLQHYTIYLEVMSLNTYIADLHCGLYLKLILHTWGYAWFILEINFSLGMLDWKELTLSKWQHSDTIRFKNEMISYLNLLIFGVNLKTIYTGILFDCIKSSQKLILLFLR
jgi:hypothetical protein